MALMLDETNLRILEKICDGIGVSVNLSALSKKLRKHRSTIKKHVLGLLNGKVIDKPVFPFFGQFKENNLLVMVYSDLPENEKTNRFLIEDPHIFMVFRKHRGEHNTILFVYHKDYLEYQLWRHSLVKKKKIPPRSERYPSRSFLFSTPLILKYKPECGVDVVEDVFRKRGQIKIGDYTLKDEVAMQILKNLVYGFGIKVNEKLLAKELDLNRKTIKRRINGMLKENILLKPACRFPKFFVPPSFLFVVSLLEMRKNEKEIISLLKEDHHIPFIFSIGIGRYNYALFSVYGNVEDHLEWENNLKAKYTDRIGAVDINYLSPELTLSIDQQKISLGIIRKKLKALRKRENNLD